MRATILLAVLAVLIGQVPASASDDSRTPIEINGQKFSSWSDYTHSDYFRSNGMRCGTPAPVGGDIDPTDCSLGNTNPAPPEYAPGVVWEIPVVVHIIMNTGGSGQISDALVQSQITVLNEDFRAMAGTPGQFGTDVTVQFALATVDPNGNPTTGITRDTNNTWFNDQGSYWTSLRWDPNRYLNFYTNSASGYLGYVPFLPNGGGAGSDADRVVILWSAFGRPGPIGPPYNLGRTATHEVGHYLGLFHTFEGGCANEFPPFCYTSGDRICDTPSDAQPTFGCPLGQETCPGGPGPDPIQNYMDYSDDSCYTNFTPEQARRNRCTLMFYRPLVYHEVVTAVRGNPMPSVRSILAQNHPNPFFPSTELAFELLRAEQVSLVVTDVNGRTLRTLTSGILPEGKHTFTWDGTNQNNVNLASGVYFYRLDTEEGSQTRRMVLVR